MAHEGWIGLALIAIIAIVLLLTVVLLVLTVSRRVYNARKYRNLDRQRASCRETLSRALESGAAPAGMLQALSARPRSIKWLAVEALLLDFIAADAYRTQAGDLFHGLGYADFYRKRLGSRNVIRKASAIDMLGKMHSAESEDRLVPMLDEESPEIVAVTVRALSRIGTPGALTAILGRMPRLLARSSITRKNVETALKNFGAAAAPTLIEVGYRYVDPVPKASILEVLANMGARSAIPFAASVLDHADPEVRSKALKLIGACGAPMPDDVKEKVRSRLTDPVWFVRLQAAKAVGNVNDEKAEIVLEKRLLDANWQVRNAAALSLTKVGDRALDVFLATLRHTDRYAKESICEEIQITNFASRLIGNLDSGDPAIRDKSREILRIMCSLEYCTPLAEYRRTGDNPRIRKEIETLMGEDPAA